MNAHGSFYSVVFVNQLKEMRTINTEQTKYVFEECPTRKDY
jgi:hypothetical protein